jgi:hypothetical protein
MSALSAWTFFGHWEDGKVIIEYVENGVSVDDRDEDFEHEEGLFSATGHGRTVDEAERAVRAEYEGGQGGPMSLQGSATEPWA